MIAQDFARVRVLGAFSREREGAPLARRQQRSTPRKRQQREGAPLAREETEA